MTKYFHNHPNLKLRRKELRNNMTPEEILLWKRLKGSQLGFKFRRQGSIGPYILDFYCPKKKLIIELDGVQHQNAVEYDNERDEFLSSYGYEVLRFSNKEINERIHEALNKIKERLSTES